MTDSSEKLAWTLRVQLEDGINFDLADASGDSSQSALGGFFRCNFNQCINQTSVAKIPPLLDSASKREPPTWNEALEWQFDDRTLKKLRRAGASIKVNFFTLPLPQTASSVPFTIPIEQRPFKDWCLEHRVADGGYVVLDLRDAVSNGKVTPAMPSAPIKMRNVKSATKHGITPHIRLAHWCALQPIWSPSPPPQGAAQSAQQCASDSRADAFSETSDDQMHEAVLSQSTIRSRIHGRLQTTATLSPPLSSTQSAKTWICRIEESEVFVGTLDSTPMRLCVDCGSDEYQMDASELRQSAFEFEHSASDTQWTLQMFAKGNEAWTTLATAKLGVGECIAECREMDASKLFALPLIDADTDTCVAKFHLHLMWRTEAGRSTLQNPYSWQPTTGRTPKRKLTLEMEHASTERRYRISVDIRSIRDVRQFCAVQCKYTHEFVASKGPATFRTKPPVRIQKCEEKPVANGFCAFQVFCSPLQLLESAKKPLTIEVTHTDSHTHDSAIGWVLLDLSQLLYAPVTRTTAQKCRLTYADEYYPVTEVLATATVADIQRQSKASVKTNVVGYLRVCASLEDFGASDVEESDLKSATDADADGSGAVAEETVVPMLWGMDPKSMIESVKALQNEVVFELKQWKREEQSKCLGRWKAAERQRVQELEAEWRCEEQLRSESLLKKKSELLRLEKRLKATLSEMETHESKLKTAAADLKKREEQMSGEHKLKQLELGHSLKRLKTDHKYEVQTLNRSMQFLKKENELLLAKYNAETRRAEVLKNEYLAFRKQMEASTVGGLKLQMSALEGDITLKTKEVSALQSANGELKKQLKASLRQVSHLEKAARESERAQLRQEKERFQRMQLQILAQSETHSAEDRSKLAAIKQSLDEVLHQNS